MPKLRSASINKQIAAIRRSMKTLEQNLLRLQSLVPSDTKNVNSRPRHLSAKGRASLVLQGRYMGYMRQLKPRQKAQVRKIRQTKGVKAAIARARHLSQA